MKKSLRILAVVLAAVLLLSGTAFAAGEDPIITPVDGNTTAVFQTGYEKLDVTYRNDAIVAGGLYMIFVVMADGDGNYIPTESSVLYINQVVAAADDTVTFNDVYPNVIANSAIMISGTGLAGPVKVATIEVPMIVEPDVLGDVDKSGEADVGDATMLLRYLAGLVSEDQVDLMAADVDLSGEVDVGDATKLLRVLAGLDTLY